MAEIKNPKCPHCGDTLQYRTTCYYSLSFFDPANGDYEHGSVEDEEDDPGIWCPTCYQEISEGDFKQAEQEKADGR